MSLTDITEDAKLLLQAIQDTRGKFGFNLPIDVLLGRKNARISKQGFDSLACHGRGRHKSEEYWKTVSRTLVQELLVDSRNGGGGKGFKGKGSQSLSVYSVSGLGKQLLEGGGSRVMADLEAESNNLEMERARRAARTAARKERVQTPARPPEPPALPPQPQPPQPVAQVPQQRASGSSPGRPAAAPPTPAAQSEWLSNRREVGEVSPGDSAAKRRKMPATLAPTPGAAPAQPAAPGSSVLIQPEGPREDGLRPAPHPGQIPSPTPLPPSLDAALMPFQRSGVAFAIRRQGRILIGDDMGLGKTIQAIATCCAFRQDWPVLIVVPNSVRLVWADELERWIPDLGPGGVNVVKSSQDLLELTKGTASFHIVTYGILTRASPVRDFLRDCRSFGCLVVDESHMIKNRAAQRTKEVIHIARTCARVVLLSGTPALARPLELYTQIEAVSPGLFNSYSAFTQRYCNPKWTPFGMDFTGASNLEELHGILRQIMVRRLKVDVLSELPSKRRQRVQLEVDKEALNTFTSLREELDGCDGQAPFAKQRVLMQMYKETGEAKAAAVSEYVEDLIHGGCKFIVFAHHLSMLDTLQAVAVRNKVKFIRIDGGVNSQERLRLVNQFQADDTVRIAILGLLAAGVGITLTAATAVVFAELHWTPGVLVQAEDRAHRIGQKNSVNIHYLIGTGTIDDIIWPAVSKKVEIVSTMCDGKKESLVAKLLGAGRATGEAAQAAAAAAEAEAARELALEDTANDAMDDLVAVVDGMTPRRQTRRRTVSPPSEQKRSRPSKKESGFSVLSMLQGKRPAFRPDHWGCGTCGEKNAAALEQCSGCGEARGALPAESAPRRNAPAPAPPTAGKRREEEAIESASDAEGDDGSGSIQEFQQFSFCVTRITGRVHLLHGDGTSMGCNFKLADWEAQREVGPPLPPELLQQPQLVAATDAFLREWVALRVTEQRQLVDQPLQVPIWRALRQRKAENVHSTRRVRQKVSAVPGGPAVACGWCGRQCNPGSVFCSQGCEEKANVRTSSAVARHQVFAVERGVCQVCGLDAHALFERVKAMTPPERHQELLRAGFKERKAMLENPNEGMFWQADHIIPVAEGGGECDITNLRTLCTMCHAKETKRLQDRLRQAGWSRNSADVRAGLARASPAAEVSAVEAAEVAAEAVVSNETEADADASQQEALQPPLLPFFEIGEDEEDEVEEDGFDGRATTD